MREPRTGSTNQESLRQRQRPRTETVPDTSKALARSQSAVPPMSSALRRFGERFFFARGEARTMQTEPSTAPHGRRTMMFCLMDSDGGTKAHPKPPQKSDCYPRHLRCPGLRPLDRAVFKCNPRFLEPSRWYSRAGCRQPMLACFPVLNGQGQRDQCVFETVDPLWRNLRGVQAPRGRVNRVPDQSTRSH